MENDGHCRYWQLLRSFSSAWLWTSCIHRGKTAWNTAYTEFYSDSTSTDLIWPSEKLEFNTKHYRSCLWHKCNSGVHKGAANILEDVLQKYVFCLACRASHIGNCNWSCLGKLKAQKTPGSKNFEMFGRLWQDLPNDNQATTSLSNSWLEKLRDKCLQTLHKILISENLPRADCREDADITGWHTSTRYPLE